MSASAVSFDISNSQIRKLVYQQIEKPRFSRGLLITKLREVVSFELCSQGMDQNVMPLGMTAGTQS
jgi:hypothetical protein